jgi:RNA polymerase sigma-70 factor (ECF subfamily)
VTPVPDDEERFRLLFDAHFADLWRFARRRCATATDADDVAAHVFATAWRRRHDLPAGDEARLWLFGIARRAVANQRRSDARRDRLGRRLAAVRDAPDVGEPDLEVSALRAALRELSDDDRTVVMMRCWDGLGVGEIASLLGCSPNAVSIRLHRARRRIAARLAAKDPAVDGHVTTAPRKPEEQAP